jgi:hypothetical protein
LVKWCSVSKPVLVKSALNPIYTSINTGVNNTGLSNTGVGGPCKCTPRLYLRNKISTRHSSPINREFYLAKGTEKFILGRYLLSGILVIFLSLRPWGVAARPAILENRGAKSHFCDYFIIRARYLYLSYYRKCRACNSLHFLFFMFFCQINSFVVTACINREFLLFLYFLFFSTPPQR